MGTDHPPRDKQAHEPTDESLSLLEKALREDEPSLGAANTPKTFTRCLRRRMPGFAGVQYRTSSAKTSFTQDNAVSWQNSSQGWRAHAPCPRGRAYLH